MQHTERGELGGSFLRLVKLFRICITHIQLSCREIGQWNCAAATPATFLYGGAGGGGSPPQGGGGGGAADPPHHCGEQEVGLEE